MGRCYTSFMITYHTKSVTNIPDDAVEISIDDHEEADTLLIIHAIEVSRRSSFQEFMIYSLDTDSILFPIHYFLDHLLLISKLVQEIKTTLSTTLHAKKL